MTPGQRIALKIIQDSNNLEDCTKSYISIRDGIGTMGKSREQICGNYQGVKTIVSNSNTMTIELRTPCMGARRFIASWRLANEGKFIYH